MGVAFARAHARRRAAAEPDQHGRPAQDDQLRALGNLGCVDVIATDGADAAGDHDGFVVAPVALPLGGVGKLEGAEVAAERGPAVLVVEACRADGTFQHDVERACDPLRFADGKFPGLRIAGDMQVRRGEADQPRLRLGAPADGALVAYFAARAGGRARIRRNGGGMVVGFHLHEDVRRFARWPVHLVLGVGEEAVCDGTFDDRGVVRICGEDPRAVDAAKCVPDHVEQRSGRGNAIDLPIGVEDLVPAVFRVRLGEHHEFRVGRVAVETSVLGDEVVDLVRRKGEPEPNIGRADVAARKSHEGPRFAAGEDALMRVPLESDRLRHAIMQQRGQTSIGAAAQAPANAALHPRHLVEAAPLKDIRRLAGPGRNRPRARRHGAEVRSRVRRRARAAAIGQQFADGAFLFAGEWCREIEKVHEFGGDSLDARVHLAQRIETLAQPCRRKGGRTDDGSDERFAHARFRFR